MSKHHCHKGCPATPICRAEPITKPGNYCLKRNIVGYIPIQSDNVTLDLNSFQIDAAALASAITADGYRSITIENGTILNASVSGLSLKNGSDLTVRNVQFRQNTALSLEVVSCQAVRIEEVDVTLGNRAMNFTSCTELSVVDSRAYNNTNNFADANPLNANNIIEVVKCFDVFMERVYANKNIKAVPTQGSAAPFQPNTAVFLIYGCQRVSLKNCQTNENTSAKGFRGLSIFGALFLLQPPFAPLPPLPVTSGVVIDGHQANDNIGNFAGLPGSVNAISIFGAPGTQLLNSETNGNIGNDQAVGTSPATATFATGVAVLGSESVVIRKHVSCFNLSHNGDCYGIVASDRSDNILIEDSVTNNNGTLDPSGETNGVNLSIGFTLQPSNGGVIRRVTSNKNKSQKSVQGIFSAFNDVVIEDCVCEFNECVGGFPVPVYNGVNGTAGGFVVFGKNVRVTRCTSNVNKATNTDASGFVASIVSPITPPSADPRPTKIIFEDCSATGNISVNDTGYGFKLGNLLDATVALSAVDCVVQKCVAIDNEVGFSQTTTSLNTFLSNVAELSVTPYENIPTGNIVTFTKATGAFSGPGVIPPTYWSNLIVA